MRFFFILFAIVSLFASAAEVRCPVCAMKFQDTAKTAFVMERNGKPARLCSFSCASKVHAKDPEAHLFAIDFHSGNRVPVDDAFFLIQSKKIVSELEFDMPPSVVAFSSERLAKEKQSKLGDGKVVKGFSAVRKAHE